MLKNLILLLVLLLGATACTLSTVPNSPSTSTPTGEVGQVTTGTPTATPTTTPSPTPTATNTPIPAPTLPNCTARTDWPIYVVAVGDTLSSIARRISSSVNELAQANCLSNPNLINPGQRLRVPRLPPLPDPDTQAGVIRVSPFVIAEGGSYTVKANTSILVSWTEARRDAVRVEFYASPFNNAPPTTLLGVDSYPGDGASISVTFSLNFQQAVHAIAYLPSGSRQLTTNRIPVFATNGGEDAAISFSPNLGIEGGATILPSGKITATWPTSLVAQATHVDFTFLRFGTQREFVGRDSNMADGAQIMWQGADIGPSGDHQFEAVAYLNNNVLGIRTAQIRFQTVPQVQGNVIVSPYLRTEGDTYVVLAGQSATLIWQGAPTSQSSQFEFTLIQDGVAGGSTSIGSDNNGSDGVSVSWTVPYNLSNARIVASARLPGQTGQSIQSNDLRVRSEVVNPDPTNAGQLVASPLVREESGWWVVQIGATVTLSWVSVPTANVQYVEFYLTPTGTGMTPTLLGTDNNLSDGASYLWTVPGGLSAHLSATAFTSDGRELHPTNDLHPVYAE